MSILVSNRVWNSSKAKGNTLLVLLALADHANKSDYCWPGVRSLARKCRLSPRTVQRCLRELQEMGEIVIDQERGPACNGGHTNGYHVMVGVDTSEDGDTQGGDDSGHGSVTKLTPPPVTKLSSKPSVDPSKEIISIIPDSSSSLVDGDVAPLELSEKKHNPPVPPTPLQTDRLDRFCDAVVKLREDFTGHPVPRLTTHQRAQIQQGLNDFSRHKVTRLLLLFAAAWGHWESIRTDSQKKFVEGFNAKHFWPPERGFKYLSAMEDFLLDEGSADPKWWDGLLQDVKKSLDTTIPASTLTPEPPK